MNKIKYKDKTKHNTKDCVAQLTILDMPKNKRDKSRLVSWLKKVVKDVETENPDDYASPCHFRLMAK